MSETVLRDLDELERLLGEERLAVRALDAPAVLAFARRKEALVDGLPNPLPAPAHARLREIAPKLRHNGVLIAHARGLLRDALSFARPNLRAGSSPSASAPPRLLSVKG